jgi:uncharacterized protein YebE (UPF0316 family)
MSTIVFVVNGLYSTVLEDELHSHFMKGYRVVSATLSVVDRDGTDYLHGVVILQSAPD